MNTEKKVLIDHEKNKKIINMTAQETFRNLLLDSMEYKDQDMFIASHYGIDVYCITHSVDDYVSLMKEIYFVAHASVEDIIVKSGLTKGQFCSRFCIPFGVFQNWMNGSEKCPVYIRLLFCRQLGFIREVEFVRNAEDWWEGQDD